MIAFRRWLSVDRIGRRAVLALALLSVLCVSTTAAPTIKITKKWDVNLKDSDYTGPGEDLVDSNLLESSTNEVTISVDSGDKPKDPPSSWIVTVRRVDSNWDDDLVISVRIAASDYPAGVVGGKLGYFEVTDSDQNFFWGTGDTDSFGLQFLIQNVSVLYVNADDFGTELQYTVTATETFPETAY